VEGGCEGEVGEGERSERASPRGVDVSRQAVTLCERRRAVAEKIMRLIDKNKTIENTICRAHPHYQEAEPLGVVE
jgi:hypothetical protein